MSGMKIAGTALILMATILALIAIVPRPAAAEPETLAKELEPFRSFLGKTWKGTGPGQDPNKPVTDISHWERALNGQAIRVLHSVNDGEYGGESLMFWDRAKQSVVFYYFTTAGFYTNGTMKFEDGKWIGHEVVTGNENNITEVRSTSEILPDGRLHSEAEYLQDGKWIEGHEFHYVEDPNAQVIFR